MILNITPSSYGGVGEYFNIPIQKSVSIGKFVTKIYNSEADVVNRFKEFGLFKENATQIYKSLKMLNAGEYSVRRITPFIHENMRKAQNIEKLKIISKLDADWNGNGAAPFSSELIAKAFGVINKIIKQPKIFPTARDSIQLEFENENGDYLEFELFIDGVKIFILYEDGRESEKFIPYNIELINKKIAEFYESKY
ncbi:hypothetical protein ABET52_04195 [Saccharococcus caldoxylosilyticus]|uniref:Uncharacterized protein n=1 Tax=Saccharococcus caldoxylosilyticus TaxID=81408 RepID=A0A150M4K8_9BACL|nr:hypothetical protein [Parageobacillus caldoxylosilyticus]KYD19306.1 hypothetical protein B4119_3600 [Parageobacillus caldoxylosilyticus]QXJ38810.1 hypothetical protein BV455_02154 [Parageobacillus caldoxylosilyticus]